MPLDEPADSATKPPDFEYLGCLLDHSNATQHYLNGSDGTPLFPSFLPPSAVWSAREKDAFFHALSIHSRLRPDLISREIKTKSVQDVCSYLSVLHTAASRQETTLPYLQRRQNLPIAIEASSEWIAMEEEKAADLIMREQDWQCELTAERRRAEIKLLKKASRAEPHDMGPSQRKAALKQQIADADLRARREDFCGSLGFPELAAIGTILCEATDLSGSSQIKPVLRAPTLQHSTGHVARPEATQTLPFSATNVADMQNLPDRGSDEGPSLLNEAEIAPTSPPKQDSTDLLAGLSPASRRRCQKRLHMRRKRASMSGVTAIDDSLERLKPGRKKVKRSPSPKDGLQCDEDEGGSMLAPSMTQKRYPRAKRMALNELQDLGLAAEDLRKLGVDVLNPEGVAKMLNLWDKLSGDTAGIGSRISIETIQLLNLHVVCFVKNVALRAITLREQEQILKSETKAWKLSGKSVLAREHIERAVSMTGSRKINKTRFFERLIAEMNGHTEADEIGRVSTGSGLGAAVSPPERDIYTPQVWVPELGDDSEMSDHTNDEELDSELLEEEELDGLDMDVEMKHESGLWDKVQRFQTSGPSVDVPITKTGQRTTYKSAEFIEDSD